LNMNGKGNFGPNRWFVLCGLVADGGWAYWIQNPTTSYNLIRRIEGYVDLSKKVFVGGFKDNVPNVGSVKMDVAEE
jgi:hypothetical protein